MVLDSFHCVIQKRTIINAKYIFFLNIEITEIAIFLKGSLCAFIPQLCEIWYSENRIAEVTRLEAKQKKMRPTPRRTAEVSQTRRSNDYECQVPEIDIGSQIQRLIHWGWSLILFMHAYTLTLSLGNELRQIDGIKNRCNSSRSNLPFCSVVTQVTINQINR